MSDVVVIGKHSFDTLVAVTPAEQERGLMFQKWPPPVMTFPYYKSAIRKFWMKNTLSPLDIIFCNDNKIVSICYGEPMSTRQIGPDVPVDLVIELPHGTVRQCGICVGDVVKTKYSQNTIAKDIGNVFRRILG